MAGTLTTNTSHGKPKWCKWAHGMGQKIRERGKKEDLKKSLLSILVILWKTWQRAKKTATCWRGERNKYESRFLAIKGTVKKPQGLCHRENGEGRDRTRGNLHCTHPGGGLNSERTIGAVTTQGERSPNPPGKNGGGETRDRVTRKRRFQRFFNIHGDMWDGPGGN